LTIGREEMRKVLFLGVIVCAWFTTCFAGSGTWISYEARNFGGGLWEYTYEVANTGLLVDSQPAAIKEFTIWFDWGQYSNLVVTTAAPLSSAWDQILWQPEPVLHDDGGYDALAKLTNPGIAAGQSVKGFSVKFNWLGQGTPGSQRYEIINPLTFKTIDAGDTIIPEPATLLLLGLGGLLVQQRRKNFQHCSCEFQEKI
jgi:hypothetical protein